MAGIHITVDDSAVTAALRRLIERTDNLRPLMLEIGEELTESTKARFASQTAPGGTRWKPLSPAYLASQRKQMSRGRDLILTLTGALRRTIRYQADNQSVAIGTNRVYAAAQQFGMEKGYAGTGRYKKRRGSFPIPWRTIPPRPFLGVSEEDRSTLLRLIAEHMERSIAD